MLPTPLRVLARTAFLLSAAALMSASCSRQGEGDRCDYDWGGPNQDCQSDLICTPCGNLQEGIVDRCCRRDATVSDPRCTPAASPSNLSCNTHKPSGAAGNPATNGTGGSGTGGTGTGGSGTGSSGTAGSGTAGSPTAGSSTAGSAGNATGGSTGTEAAGGNADMTAGSGG